MPSQKTDQQKNKNSKSYTTKTHSEDVAKKDITDKKSRNSPIKKHSSPYFSSFQTMGPGSSTSSADSKNSELQSNSEPKPETNSKSKIESEQHQELEPQKKSKQEHGAKKTSKSKTSKEIDGYNSKDRSKSKPETDQKIEPIEPKSQPKNEQSEKELLVESDKDFKNVADSSVTNSKKSISSEILEQLSKLTGFDKNDLSHVKIFKPAAIWRRLFAFCFDMVMIFGISFTFSSFWIFGFSSPDMVKTNEIYINQMDKIVQMENGQNTLLNIQTDLASIESLTDKSQLREETKNFLSTIESQCSAQGISDCFVRYRRTERSTREFFKVISVILYYTVPTAIFGQTLGKWALKIKVVSQSGAIKLAFWQAAARDILSIFFFLTYFIYFGYSIPNAIIIVMFISVAYVFGLVKSLFTPTKATLGDTMGQTIVVQQVNQEL